MPKVDKVVQTPNMTSCEVLVRKVGIIISRIAKHLLLTEPYNVSHANKVLLSGLTLA